MKRKNTLVATTALLTAFVAAGPRTAAAQAIPSCDPAGDPVELSALGPDALGDLSPAEIPGLLDGDVLCVAADGTLDVSEALGAGDAGSGAGATAEAAPTPETEAETGADVESSAEADVVPTPGTEAGAASSAEADVAPTPETDAEANAAAAGAEVDQGTVEELAEELAEDVEAAGEAVVTDEATGGAETSDTPVVSGGDAAPAPDAAGEATAAGEAEAGSGAPLPESGGTEVETSGDVVAEGSAGSGQADGDASVTVEADGAPVAAAAADEAAGSEPVDTTVETVTEEEARSSDEDFAAAAEPGRAEAGAAGDDDDDGGGLSNFEKFALGAAGLVVLDQLIDSDERVVENTGDRVVVERDDGTQYILKDDDVLLRRPGADVKTETFSDGSTRTTVTRDNGVRVITVSAADGRVLRRVKVMPDGRSIVLFDDTVDAEPVRISDLPPPPRQATVSAGDDAALRAALAAESAATTDRRFSLRQVRNHVEVRELMPEINIDAINFETGSAAIRPEEARDLTILGEAMRDLIAENPDELFLIEGHTDAVGSASLNLALSDRRAESVALALAEYFDVPPENMIVQGYGERHLLVPTGEAERANRRATVRRITPLLTVASRN